MTFIPSGRGPGGSATPGDTYPCHDPHCPGGHSARQILYMLIHMNDKGRLENTFPLSPPLSGDNDIVLTYNIIIIMW